MSEQLCPVDQLVGASDGGLVHPLKYEQKSFAEFDPNFVGTQVITPTVTEIVVPGMTYRQWLIGQAITGYLANVDCDASASDKDIDVMCGMFERYADRIIARMEQRRSKKNEPA